MKKMSNAMLDDVEIELKDRWSYGPLELAFLPSEADACSSAAEPSGPRTSYPMAVIEWNRRHQSGFVRTADTCEVIEQVAPGVLKRESPNIILVPQWGPWTELHRMLASLLPDDALERIGVARESAVMFLYDFHRSHYDAGAAERVEQIFGRMMWRRLCATARLRSDAFAPRSSLRLLAGDARLWMNRVYRVAMDREQELGVIPDEKSDSDWRSLSDLERDLLGQHPDLAGKVVVRRPRYGGTIWSPDDPEDRDAVLDEAIYGVGEMESIEPIVETLLRHPTHDDFSDRVSWIKTDFERAFYSKRSPVRVDLVETIDDYPAWNADEPLGYDDVLFRDILAYFDERDRRLLIAVRNGRTVTSIAEGEGYANHAPVSRRLKRVRRRLARLLGMEPPPGE